MGEGLERTWVGVCRVGRRGVVGTPLCMGVGVNGGASPLITGTVQPESKVIKVFVHIICGDQSLAPEKNRFSSFLPFSSATNPFLASFPYKTMEGGPGWGCLVGRP